MEKKSLNGKVIEMRPNGRPRVRTFFDHDEHPSLTHQEMKDQCDVNLIVKKHQAQNPTEFKRWFNSPPESGVYADFTNIPSYQEALNTIIKADQAFEELPSKLRQRFENDPQQLIEFLDDPKNMEESIRLGLRIKREAPPENPIEKTLNQIAKNTTPKTPKKPLNDED